MKEQPRSSLPGIPMIVGLVLVLVAGAGAIIATGALQPSSMP